MVEFLGETINNLIYGFAAFGAAFLVLNILWGMLIRVSESLFSRSRFYFVSKLLIDINRSILVIIALISFYIGAYIYDRGFLDGLLLKIWGVVFIVAVMEALARIILSFIDTYYKKFRKAPGFLQKILPIVKGIIGFFLYGLAFLLIISYMSYEVGSIVALMAVVILIFSFAISYDHLKNIFCGFQVAGGDLIREGDFISINEVRGFVERVMSQCTIIRSPEGKTVTVPNSIFVKENVKNSYYPEGNLISLKLVLETKDAVEDRKKIEAIAGKAGLDLEKVANDFKPRVNFLAVEGGKAVYEIKFLLMPNSDLNAVLGLFSERFYKEYGEKIDSLHLE